MLEPATAAERVGVSASGLRRLAPIYEEIHGELPRKPNSNNRLWPEEAVERLRDARRLVELGRCRTILEALRALENGVSVEELEMEPVGRQTGSDMAVQQTLEVLLEKMAALHAEVAELRSEVAASRALPGVERAGAVEGRSGSADGPLVRVARWLEQRVRGRGGSS